jgi:hypothetical protein
VRIWSFKAYKVWVITEKSIHGTNTLLEFTTPACYHQFGGAK